MGDVPFREVYIHALVRDAEGQKMAKTRGNVIDPLVVTEKFGTDAVRMALLLGAAPGTDIVLTEERMASARAFANKLWNAARFLFLNMERSGVEPRVPASPLPEALEDRWILSRLNSCAEAAGRAIEKYRYHEAAQLLWQFLWHEFCDWYVEIKKLRFTANSGLNTDWLNVLYVFEKSLQMLHPLMPFITEELHQRLGSSAMLAVAAYPWPIPDLDDQPAEREMELVQEIITAARNLRADLKADPKQPLAGVLYARGAVAALARSQQDVIEKLANVTLELASGAAAHAGGAVRSTPEFDLLLRLPLAQADTQRKRLAKEIEQLDKVIANSRRQLEDQEFLSRAPGRVVDSIRVKLADYEAQLNKSRAALEALAEA
jgi:valyl-tRNA synthetase